MLCSLHQVDLRASSRSASSACIPGQIVFDGPASDLDDATLTLIYHQTKPGSPVPATAAVEAGGRH